MILFNRILILAYIFVVIFQIYIVFFKGKINKFNIISSIYLLLILVFTLNYYKPTNLGNIVEDSKYNTLFQDSTNVLAEEIENPSLETADIKSSLINIQVRNTSKNYKKIKSEFINEQNSYVIQQGGANIFRITVLGNYEYIEYGGRYYRCIE